MNKPLIIIGAGGHASVLVDILRQQKRSIIGIVSPSLGLSRSALHGIHHYTNDDDVLNFDPNDILLVNGIGSLPGSNLRAEIFDKFSALGFEFSCVVASDATISDFARLSHGVQILNGSIVQAGCVIGDNTIVNTGTSIDHDSHIGENNHLAPGVTISGQVNTKANVHFGTGASVIHNISIGNDVVIGAGATITADIENNMICYPPRIIKKVLDQNA